MIHSSAMLLHMMLQCSARYFGKYNTLLAQQGLDDDGLRLSW
jgi:hypothetical protein